MFEVPKLGQIAHAIAIVGGWNPPTGPPNLPLEELGTNLSLDLA
jgi:hypothetical protein